MLACLESIIVFRTFLLLTAIVAICFLISGLDDLFIDVFYWLRELYRGLFKRTKIRSINKQELDAIPEKWAAVFIPAWQEEAVIQKMLLNSLQSFDYENFDIFLGTYPNDEPTRLKAAQVRERDRRVRIVVCPHPGPTNKADCLNWVYQGMLLAEREKGIRYEIIVLHDSEDVVHPLELKLYNCLIPRKDMVQVPVVPLEMPARYLTAGTYLDEFAENHSKDLLVRERISHMIPSAGVGTGVSRRALEELAARHNNEPFSTKSVTEDYEFGIRVAQLQLEGIFAKFRVVRTQSVKRGIWQKKEEIREVRELVATREFFPDRMALAVRQKSRWILGIALQGWKNIGWPKGFWRRYMLFRDRKSLATNLINMLGYTTLAYWLFLFLTCPGLPSSSLNHYHWVWSVIVADTILMLHRWLQRFVAVKGIADTKQAFLSIPRSVLLNFINFAATIVALKQFLSSELSGKRVVWAKTSHAYPDAEQLREYRRKLGDLLLENRLITVAQLRHALDDQRAGGGKLGSILVQRGYLAEEDLVSALGRQLRVPSCEIDLRAIDTSVLEKLQQDVAEGLQVLPLRRSGGYVEVATTTPSDEDLKKHLEGLFDSPVKFILAGEKDLQFMIPRAYLRRASPKQPLLGETLIAAGLITEEDLRKALKAQKAAGRKLGEVLQDMNLVTPEAIQGCLNASCVLWAQNGGY